MYIYMNICICRYPGLPRYRRYPVPGYLQVPEPAPGLVQQLRPALQLVPGQWQELQPTIYTMIGRKNEREFDNFTSLTTRLGHLKSSFNCSVRKLLRIVNRLCIGNYIKDVPNFLREYNNSVFQTGKKYGIRLAENLRYLSMTSDIVVSRENAFWLICNCNVFFEKNKT